MPEQITSTKTTIAPAPTPNLNTKEAAKFLNIKPATLDQHRWRGTGPRFVKIGRCVRYRMADLDAFLTEQTFSSTTEAQHQSK